MERVFSLSAPTAVFTQYNVLQRICLPTRAVKALDRETARGRRQAVFQIVLCCAES
jgi:hypothetical protein